MKKAVFLIEMTGSYYRFGPQPYINLEILFL